MREYPVRICERLGVKLPGPTRQSRRAPIVRQERSSGSRRRGQPNAIHSAAKIEVLPATRRDDAIPQRADVVGDGLPVASPGSGEVRLCIGPGGGAAAWTLCHRTPDDPPPARSTTTGTGRHTVLHGVHSLIETMVEWRRCEFNNQMGALGAEEVRAHAQLAKRVPAASLPDRCGGIRQAPSITFRRLSLRRETAPRLRGAPFSFRMPASQSIRRL
jgi:hypothetical protein